MQENLPICRVRVDFNISKGRVCKASVAQVAHHYRCILHGAGFVPRRQRARVHDANCRGGGPQPEANVRNDHSDTAARTDGIFSAVEYQDVARDSQPRSRQCPLARVVIEQFWYTPGSHRRPNDAVNVSARATVPGSAGSHVAQLARLHFLPPAPLHFRKVG